MYTYVPLAISRLLFSTIAEAAIAMTEKTRPTPTLCRLVSPWAVWVTFLAMGTKSRSFREVKRRMLMNRKVEKEPEGIVKDPIFRAMILACSTVKVVIWE